MSLRLLMNHGLGQFATSYSANDPGNKTVTGADANMAVPDDARAGVRLLTNGRVQTGTGVNAGLRAPIWS